MKWNGFQSFCCCCCYCCCCCSFQLTKNIVACVAIGLHVVFGLRQADIFLFFLGLQYLVSKRRSSATAAPSEEAHRSTTACHTGGENGLGRRLCGQTTQRRILLIGHLTLEPNFCSVPLSVKPVCKYTDVFGGICLLLRVQLSHVCDSV